MQRTVMLPGAALALFLSVLAPLPASSAGGMQIPSTGSIGTTGLFLSCRNGSSASTTPYYDQQNVLRDWDCGEGKRPHKGVDILGSPNPGITPVYAAAPGEVWTAERGNGLGWRVVLRHGQVGGNGRHTYTIYGHMGNCDTGESYIAPAITPGKRVSAGELLGWQGNDSHPSSCASRSHLHWEVRAADSDVSNVFLATPASPNFYTGTSLTADDPSPATSVSAGTGTGGEQGPAPSALPIPIPTALPDPHTWVNPAWLDPANWTLPSPGAFPRPSAWPSPGTWSPPTAPPSTSAPPPTSAPSTPAPSTPAPSSAPTIPPQWANWTPPPEWANWTPPPTSGAWSPDGNYEWFWSSGSEPSS